MTKCPVQKQAHISAQHILLFYLFFTISKMISPRNVELPPCTVNDFHWGFKQFDVLANNITNAI